MQSLFVLLQSFFALVEASQPNVPQAESQRWAGGEHKRKGIPFSETSSWEQRQTNYIAVLLLQIVPAACRLPRPPS